MEAQLDWGKLDKKARRKAAERLFERRDEMGLMALMTYYMRLHSRSGASTSKKTFEAYRTGLRSFLAWAEKVKTRDFLEGDSDLMLGYIRDLESRGLKPNSVNLKRSAARALFKALRWAKVTTADPFADVPSVRDPVAAHEKRDAYQEADVAALVSIATPHERAMILLGAQAGLRISEVLALRWEDVDLTTRRLTVQHGKGGKRANVALAGPLIAALEALPIREGKVIPWSEPRTARSHMKRLCEQASVRWSRRHFHGLRHYAGTTVLQMTGRIEEASAHLRHSSIQTTTVYAKRDRRVLEGALSAWNLGKEQATD